MSASTKPANDAAAMPEASFLAQTNPSTEDEAAFAAVLADLTRRHAPEGAVEAHWVEQMAMTMLRTRWADALEQLVVEAALAGEVCKALPSASVLVRWRARVEKDFCRAARELSASKAARGAAAPAAARPAIDPHEAAFEAELARDPRAAIARLLAEPDPFGDGGTNDPEPFAGFKPRGTNEPERPLNRAERRRRASRNRAA